MSGVNGQARLYIQEDDEQKRPRMDLLLDFEQAFEAEGFITFKSYMPDGRTVQFSVAKEELFDELEKIDPDRSIR